MYVGALSQHVLPRNTTQTFNMLQGSGIMNIVRVEPRWAQSAIQDRSRQESGLSKTRHSTLP
eukprot:15433742-Alexandrium_andersonii.AAC.1